MAFSKITSAELVDKGVSGLPDVPGLSSADMQKKFDELSKDVVIPKFNKLIEDMASQNGAANIGMEVPEGIEADANTKAVVHALAKQTKENSDEKHGHVNKSVLDLITDTVKKAYDRLVSLFENVTEISDTVVDKSESLPTGKAIVAYVKKMGGGDMATSVYDKNNSGVVDDAEMLGGELPEVFQKTTSEYLETDSKDVVGAINEVNEKAKNGGKDLIADAFSEEIDYNAGVYVTYDNKLWVFTDAKAAGEWNAAVVESVTLGAELSQLTENLANHVNNTGIDLLWTNPDTSTSFSPQKISGDFSKYSFFVVACKYSTTVINYHCNIVFKNLDYLTTARSSKYEVYRYYNFSDTEMEVGAGKNSDGQDDNTLCIPVYIYGIRL